MVDFSRYRGILVVGLSVLVALALADCLLAGLSGLFPHWLQPRDRPEDWGDIEKAGRRVAGVVVEQRQKNNEPGKRLAVILGESTSREGLDPEVLDDQGPQFLRWFSVYGSGGSVYHLVDLSQVFFFSNLRPAVIILAINPFMLAGAPYLAVLEQVEPFDLESVVQALRAGGWNEVWPKLEGGVESTSWIVRHRRLLTHDSRVVFFQGRVRLLESIGANSDALFAPDPDPWRTQPAGYPSQMPEEHVRAVWEYSYRLGRFDPQSYTEKNPRAAALVAVINKCRLQGAKVYILLMPEKTLWRNQVPAQAKQLLLTILRHSFAEETPPVIDLRDCVPDDMFCDYFHLNARGRKATSLILARKLRSILTEQH